MFVGWPLSSWMFPGISERLITSWLMTKFCTKHSWKLAIFVDFKCYFCQNWFNFFWNSGIYKNDHFLGPFSIDWCCFYYFVRNSLVALLEALCAQILCFRFVNIGFFLTFLSPFLCVCKALVSNKSLFPASLNQATVSGCRHSSCVLIIHVCLCMWASVRACWKCVGKVMNIEQI